MPSSAGHHAPAFPAGDATNKLTAAGAWLPAAGRTPPRLLRRHVLVWQGPVRGCLLHKEGSSEERDEFGTQAIDRRFQGLIEHIAHHDHTAWHPLPPPAQFWVVELGHRAMAVHQGMEQGQHRFRTHTITLGEFRDFLLSFRR